MGAPYGQHFLTDRRAVGAILDRFAPCAEDRIIEIGPGRGALTRLLSVRSGAFAAVEIDSGLARPLAEFLGLELLESSASGCPAGPPRAAAAAPAEREAGGHAAGSPRHPSEAPEARRSDAAPEAVSPRFLLRADALEVRYADLAALLGARPGERLRVIGNLPYSVATALLQRMAAERDLIADAMVMVQKEVADRILAPPGGKTYGILSVLLSLCSERSRVLSLGPRSFSPPPKVDSAVIALRFLPPGPDFREGDARLLDLLRAAFSERRKKLAGNLAKHYAIDKPRAARLLAEAGADPGARAEQVGPDAFLRLARLLAGS
jgi:16S rRNA (adenine1518-N6/adenine1519-N6)-dimethyltransferase